MCVDGEVYVRTWQRRDAGWYGDALRSHQAGIGVPGLTADVRVEDVGEGTPELRRRVDAAYRDKYGGLGSESMVTATATAAASTLRLDPMPGTASGG